ncbi:MAG: TRAP transporter substrate-binding protein DctP [Burkholderiaceae bacterium]
MRLKLFAATFVSALVTVWASQVSAETRLRLLSSFDNLNPSVLSADAFIASVAARSGGEYRISRTGPEAVPVGEQLEPTSSGVFDLLFTNGAFHAGRTGVGMVIDSLKTDLELRYSSGLVEYLDNYYQKAHGVKLIALSSGSAYQFLLRDPVAADGGLKGRKIRSLPQYGKLIEALGGVPVTLAPTQMYSSLEKGVIDGVGFPQTAATQYKLQEVIKYIAEPTFGATHIMILMNLRKWNALPPDVQKMFLEEGRT